MRHSPGRQGPGPEAIAGFCTTRGVASIADILAKTNKVSLLNIGAAIEEIAINFGAGQQGVEDIFGDQNFVIGDSTCGYTGVFLAAYRYGFDTLHIDQDLLIAVVLVDKGARSPVVLTIQTPVSSELPLSSPVSSFSSLSPLSVSVEVSLLSLPVSVSEEELPPPPQPCRTPVSSVRARA